MRYVLDGRLCGYACDDCEEPLRNVEVALYRPDRKSTQEVAAVAADPADTFAILTAEQVEARKKDLLVTVTTGDDGAFSAELPAKRYDGGAVEVVVTVSGVDGVEPARGREPVTFTITTLQPRWREREDVMRAYWDHCLSARFWCAILGRLGIWTICGRLTTCEEGAPIPGATVSAFDADWIQDDSLGSGVTDLAGHFRIVYRASDFERTPLSPFINVELTRGPDVYFSATLGGSTILDEPRSMGRTRGRENVGPCFCVELCSGEVAGGGGPEQNPHWMRVEVFDVFPPAGSPGAQFSAGGYAGDPMTGSYVFGGGVHLDGNCPLRNIATGNPLEYRFKIGEWTWPAPGDDPTTPPSVPPAALSPVTAIVSTRVGYVWYTDGNGNAASAPVDVTATDSGDGWIRLDGRPVTVPMFDPPGSTAVVNVSSGNFLRTFALFTLNSPAITGTHAPKMPGELPKAQAGRSLTVAEREPVRRYALEFEVRDAVTLATVHTDTLSSIVLDNSRVVVALNLEELMVSACNPLGGANDVHVLYTVDHPHLRDFSVSIGNNSGTAHPPPAHSGSATVAMPSGTFAGSTSFRGGASGPSNAAGTGGVAVDVSMDPPCAYAVTLGWQTRRWGDIGHGTQILYCK